MKLPNASKTAVSVSFIAVSASSAFSQSATAAAEASLGNVWLYVAGVSVIIVIGGVVAWHFSRRGKQIKPISPSRSRKRVTYEWTPNDKATSGNSSGSSARSNANPSLQGLNMDEVKERMEKIKYSRLPINRLAEPADPPPFMALAASIEDELMEAIESADCEFEPDEEVRDKALDVLARHKTSNSVEMVSQVALYDLSAQIRSKAVSILAEYDHESVFETVILSCADPAREVRAAAARSLFRLTFNRAEAWTRIAQCGDSYRMTQVARAAIEADFVDRSIERLIHEDVNYAREALALIALLIRAGETADLFEYLRKGEDLNTKLAILRVFKIVSTDAVVEQLAGLKSSGAAAPEILSELTQVLEERSPVIA